MTTTLVGLGSVLLLLTAAFTDRVGLTETRTLRSLVVTGSPTRPTGVFQARSGELVIASVSDSTIRGFFRLEATWRPTRIGRTGR